MGVASSAIGIAGFGLQLTQVLNQYFSDVGSASQKFHATLQHIKAANRAIRQIHELLEQERTNVERGHKAILFSAQAIVDIRTTNDECLKLFWKIEAFLISNRKDSTELEAEILAKLTGYYAQLKDKKDPKPLELDERLEPKLRKLTLSRRKMLQWPFASPTLDQYNKELHGLQMSLALMFQIITLGALSTKKESVAVLLHFL